MVVWLLTEVMSSKLPDEEINNNKKNIVTPMTYKSYRKSSALNEI